MTLSTLPTPFVITPFLNSQSQSLRLQVSYYILILHILANLFYSTRKLRRKDYPKLIHAICLSLILQSIQHWPFPKIRNIVCQRTRQLSMWLGPELTQMTLMATQSVVKPAQMEVQMYRTPEANFPQEISQSTATWKIMLVAKLRQHFQ